jgi:hypothetical protein
MFLRTSVPGYRYGSELWLIQIVERSAKLFKTDLALDVSLKGTPRFFVHCKTFQPQGRECFAVSLFALSAFLLGGMGVCHTFSFYQIWRIFKQLSQSLRGVAALRLPTLRLKFVLILPEAHRLPLSQVAPR